MADTLTLLPLATEDDWAAFHAIRKAELFEARGRGHVYDPDHPDDRAPGNMPMLLRAGGEPAGVLRIDFVRRKRAVLRLLAIRSDRQGEGLGGRMVGLALDTIRARGFHQVTVNAAKDAVPFYRRLGFAEQAWPDTYEGELSAETVQMVLTLERR